jgi:hypothetical protein
MQNSISDASIYSILCLHKMQGKAYHGCIPSTMVASYSILDGCILCRHKMQGKGKEGEMKVYKLFVWPLEDPVRFNFINALPFFFKKKGVDSHFKMN